MGIKKICAFTVGLMVLLLVSSCASNQPQQKPIPQPPQNEQKSTSGQNPQSSADQTRTTPSSASSSTNEPRPQAPENPSDLNEELSESLGTFDEILLTEQERIDNNRPFDSSQESTASGSPSDQDAHSPDTGLSSANPEAPTGNVDPEQGSEQQTTGQTTSTGTPPRQTQKSDGSNAGIDGRDDDIVARQLREAAEKEQDPQLKEKLWEEYYRYKQENVTE